MRRHVVHSLLPAMVAAVALAWPAGPVVADGPATVPAAAVGAGPSAVPTSQVTVPRLRDATPDVVPLGATDAGVAVVYRNPVALAGTGYGTVWVGTPGNALRPTGLVVTSVRHLGSVGARVGWAGATFATGGRPTLYRLSTVDVVTGSTTVIPTGTVAPVAWTGDGWVELRAGSLVLHRATRPDVVVTTGVAAVAAATTGGGVTALAVDDADGGCRVLTVDAGGSARVVARPTGGCPLGLVAGPGRLAWGAGPSSTVSVLDLTTGRVSTSAVPQSLTLVALLPTAVVLASWQDTVLSPLTGGAPTTLPGWTPAPGGLGGRAVVRPAPGVAAPGVYTVDAAGIPALACAAPPDAESFSSIDLAGGAVHATTSSPTRSLRTPLLPGTRLALGARGVENNPSRDVAHRSAGRSVAGAPLNLPGQLPETTVFDRGVPSGFLAGSIQTSSDISGPWVHRTGDVWLADGTPVRTGSDWSGWGVDGPLRVLPDTGDLTLDRLDRPLSATNPRQVPLTSDCSSRCTTELVGDFVAWQDRGTVTVANWRTGATRVLATDVLRFGLGDRLVAWSTRDDPFRLSVLDLADPGSAPWTLPGGLLADVERRDVAWQDAAGDLHLARFGAGAAPRVLGALAAGSFSPGGDGTRDAWTFQADADTPLRSATLTLRTGTTTVRTLTGPAPDGSVRLAWDGRDTAGRLVPPGSYRWTLAGQGADGSGALTGFDGGPASGTVTVSAPGGRLRAVAPQRILDTRIGLGAAVGTVGPGSTLTLQVTGRGGVPTGGVGWVTVTVTAVRPTVGTFVTVHPGGTATPGTSTLNVPAGAVVSNLAVVPVGPDGTVAISNAAGALHLVADVSAWLPADAEVTPVGPTRLVDTRIPLGGLGYGAWQLGGRGGVPLGGGTALLNVTVVAPREAVEVAVGTPAGSGWAVATGPERTSASAVLAPLGADGSVAVQRGAGDVVVDPAGWIPPGAQFTATPQRALDTLAGIGAAWAYVSAGSTVRVPIAGRSGVPTAGVSAVAVVATARYPRGGGYLTVFPGGTARPVVSQVSFPAAPDGTSSGLVILPVGADGSVSVYTPTSTHLALDVVGWFAS